MSWKLALAEVEVLGTKTWFHKFNIIIIIPNCEKQGNGNKFESHQQEVTIITISIQGNDTLQLLNSNEIQAGS